MEPWRSHFQRRERHYAARWEEALARCFPSAAPEDLAGAAQAAIGMIHSVAHWPRQSRKSEDLPNLLFRLVTHGLGSLQALGDAKLALMAGEEVTADDAALTPLGTEAAESGRKSTRRKRSHAA